MHGWDILKSDEEYVGKSVGIFGERFKENLRAPSPIYDHANTTGYQTRVDSYSIMGMEPHKIARTIKGAMYIRINDPSLNRNI